MKKIIQVDFLRHALPKSKIGLPNFVFNECSCSKRPIKSDWHVKRYLFIKFEENRYSHFWNIHLRSYFRSVLPHFRKTGIGKYYLFTSSIFILRFHISFIYMWMLFLFMACVFFLFGRNSDWCFILIVHLFFHFAKYIQRDLFSVLLKEILVQILRDLFCFEFIASILKF